MKIKYAKSDLIHYQKIYIFDDEGVGKKVEFM